MQRHGNINMHILMHVIYIMESDLLVVKDIFQKAERKKS